MHGAFARIVEAQKPALHACPVCPVKGTCVFVTTGYEPGYCLYEYRLLHAFVAQRLRAHPPAGASRFDRLTRDAQEFVARIRAEAPYGTAQGRFVPPVDAWPAQATLSSFDAP